MTIKAAGEIMIAMNVQTNNINTTIIFMVITAMILEDFLDSGFIYLYIKIKQYGCIGPSESK